jgi:UDP-3-O-[3-hydroxymyristoyl] glucosamine N-acyltransferase
VRIVGPKERTITHPASIREAQSELAITFCNKSAKMPLELIRATRANVVICADGAFVDELAHSGKTLVAVTNPRLSFMHVVQAFFAEPKARGRHPTAIIDPNARIHPDTYIGPFAYVGNCEIADGAVIHAHVCIHSGTRIGRNVVIHSGTVIGGDGFGYERNEDGELEKFPHIGGVIIEDEVEIGANTCIDRGTLGDTIIRKGTKIDNLVHIAHNVTVGRHTAIIAHAMIGGSAHIGDHAWIAPCACIRDTISVGDRAMVGLGALVVKDVPDDTAVMGAPARPVEEYKRILKAIEQAAGTSVP